MKVLSAILALGVLGILLVGCGDSATSDRRVAGTGPGPSLEGKRYDKPDQVLAPGHDYEATIVTDKGSIVLHLFAAKAPRTVNSFVFLVQKKYFDGVTFHRVVPDFIVQGGDPTGKGNAGPGYQVEEDQNDLLNKRGTVSMAKVGGSTMVGSQFFINLTDNARLDADSANDKRFYPFAEVTAGMDVVEGIVPGDVMRSVTVRELP